jgi:hypothetical protein
VLEKQIKETGGGLLTAYAISFTEYRLCQTGSLVLSVRIGFAVDKMVRQAVLPNDVKHVMFYRMSTRTLSMYF